MAEENVLENKLLVFKIRGEEYAISVENVGGIEKVLPITRVPSTPPFIKGVINLRGVVSPVIDLKEKFHRQKTEFTDKTRIIVINMEDISVGLIVEEASDVVDMQADEIKPPPEVVGSKVDDFIQGVLKLEKRLLILLDLDKVLNKEDLAEYKLAEGK